MNGAEKAIVIAALIHMGVYVPYILVQGYRGANGAAVPPAAIVPMYITGMALNFVALLFTIKDLYLRPFTNPNSKLTWLLLILLTGGIGWLVYVFKHALWRRPTVDAP